MPKWHWFKNSKWNIILICVDNKIITKLTPVAEIGRRVSGIDFPENHNDRPEERWIFTRNWYIYSIDKMSG